MYARSLAGESSEPEYIQMTEAEYLAFEETSEIRHEYGRGRVYAMTGGSLRHSIITVNISTQLNIQLDDKNCTTLSPDLRVYIASKQGYRYPDVTVFCGEPVYMAGRIDTITNPSVLVEVLSPSTAVVDRNEKLEEYLQIETLHAYLLVSQFQIKVERFMRHETGEWLYSIFTDLTDEVALPEIGCTVALSKIYQKVNWDEGENL